MSTSNPPIDGFSLQAADGYCTFKLMAGVVPLFMGDSIYVATPGDKSYTFPRANPDPAMYMPLNFELTSTAQSETVGPDGVAVWTAMAGGTVSIKPVKLRWQGKAGDTPPTVTGPGGEVLTGYFSEANRVDTP